MKNDTLTINYFRKIFFILVFCHSILESSAQSIYAGYVSSLYLCSNGTLQSWGSNTYGQLGDGTTMNRLSPVNVLGISNVKYISGGLYSHFIALKYDGTIWAWGYNQDGELGNGTNVNSSIPLQVGNDTDWIMVSGGGYHTEAIKSNGTLWAWGQNWYGQLGDSTTLNRFFPVQIGTDSDWVYVAGMGLRTLAIKSNGTLWAWGDNYYGQLGIGTTDSSHFPVQVGTATNWWKVGGGWHNSLGIKTDGTLWTWGWNGNGQLGDGSIIDKLSPNQIGTDTNWVEVGAGMKNSIAMKSDSTIWTCGANSQGELGIGSTAVYHTFIQVPAIHSWTKFSAGGGHILALSNDSLLWDWGWNSSGQLGDGNNQDKLSPQRIFGLCTGCSNFTINALATNTSCNSCSDGIAFVNIQGGTSPYNYTWYTSPIQTSDTVSGLANGNYVVCVNDASGCAMCDSVIVATGNCSANYSLYADVLPHQYIAVNMANGVPPLSYDWSWGDGTSDDTLAYPSHLYANAGFYNICLTITDSTGCTHSHCNSFYLMKNLNTMISVNIIPDSSLGFQQVSDMKNISLYPNPASKIFYLQNIPIGSTATIQIINTFGEIMLEKKNVQNLQPINIELASGLYFVKINFNKESYLRKLLVK